MSVPFKTIVFEIPIIPLNKTNKMILRGASSTVRNERTSMFLLEEPAMKGSNSHPCKYSILVFRDEVTVLIESGLVQVVI
jgi:hypothetical protein